MVSLIINLALFFLVMFVVVPGIMIFAMIMRDHIHHSRKHHEHKLVGRAG